jgi:hypothetical protein
MAILTQATTLTTTASETTIVTADAAFRNDLVGLVITPTTTGAVGTLTLRNTTGGAAVAILDYPISTTIANDFPLNIQFPVALQGAGQNTNWTIQSSSASNSFHVLAEFTKGS